MTRTYLHPTRAGLALQTNDQGFSWLGQECVPRWSVRAKPYIYRVHRATGTDVIVGTDGNGGRLLAFDADSGRESLNLKPALGGLGTLSAIPGSTTLVSTFCVSRSYAVPARLLVLSLTDRSHTLDHECVLLLGTWFGGAVCRTGRDRGRIGLVDLCPSDLAAR